MKALITQMDAMCACGCDRVPESVNPLPDGWCWDTAEEENPWLWCPESTRRDWSAEEFGGWLRIQRAFRGMQTKHQPWPKREGA